jgi:hypothetical protein
MTGLPPYNVYRFRVRKDGKISGIEKNKNGDNIVVLLVSGKNYFDIYLYDDSPIAINTHPRL